MITQEEFLATIEGDKLIHMNGDKFTIVEVGAGWRKSDTGAVLPFPDAPDYHLRAFVGIEPAIDNLRPS